ncbi:hypothetical protein [Pseudaminobacter soli (ex Li et al. 2025)]|uniref:hypothetical protein n=1 Tax=Pseudaminobacter soli (ex Li et al. 2025) TaxID=1295366 RepID=UPI0015E736D8|nr:hypothetical protein [Mesorhizobium soli]
MNVVIEFYRLRELDNAHALLGRVTCDVIDTDAAIGLARSLFRTLDMPQDPDIVSINDDLGRELYCATVRPVWKEAALSERRFIHEGQQQ